MPLIKVASASVQLNYLARNGADFLKAAVENVIQQPPPFYERAVHYNGLSDQAVDTLEQEFRARQQALLEHINARAAALRQAEAGLYWFRAGGYFYRETET